MSDVFHKCVLTIRRHLTRLTAWSIARHIKLIRRFAYSQGKREGLTAGRLAGKEEGFNEGRLVYEVVEALPLEPKSVDQGLYGPGRLGDAATAARMRQDVAAKVRAGLIKAPTDEQWEMILTDHPATCVSAGAGSGKSTTLVLRVIYMLEYLKISDQELTVISFTVNSCAELRKKLVETLGLWRTGISSADWQQWAKDRVRTFHSLLYHMAKSELPGRSFFELLEKTESDGLSENDAGGDIDNPASGMRLGEAQVAVLAEAYRSLFRSDEPFRNAVIEILKVELCSTATKSGEKINGGLVYYSGLRDLEVVKKCSDSWRISGWPFDGVVDEPVELATVAGRKFYANGYHRDTLLPVVLGFAPSLTQAQKDAQVGEGKGAIGFAIALASRNRIIAHYAEREYIYIRDEPGLAAYRGWAEYAAGSAKISPNSNVPMFKVKLQGEKKSLMIYEALFAQGSFIETLGWEVTDLLGKLPARQHIDTTANFYHALGRFWPHLNSHLEKSRVHTFNRAFLALTRTSGRGGRSPQSPSAMRYLLVDEFQDISPLIVGWLKEAQRSLLVKDQVKGVSIMAIGDDWQSIYGWRGSAPQLFIDFNKHFPVHGDLGSTKQLLFKTNFRSVDLIVSDAARLLGRVEKKVKKDSVAVLQAQPGDHGVKLTTYGDPKKSMRAEESAKRLLPFIKAEYNAAALAKGAKPELLIVMTRRGNLRNVLAKELPAKKFVGLKVCTYHQAKGLEADTAILIEDCVVEESHTLRNMLYAASGMYDGYTYDAASRDEAMRLAYVGVTRGRRKVFWKVPALVPDGAAATFSLS